MSKHSHILAILDNTLRSQASPDVIYVNVVVYNFGLSFHRSKNSGKTVKYIASVKSCAVIMQKVNAASSEILVYK